MTATTTDETISVDDFRAKAREWLAANCERKTAEAIAAAGSLRGQHEFTKEQIDAERPKQKRLYEAGFAGITWPKEFGGQGLTGAHELAFIEESKAYVLPNFGIAGGTTFGVCAQVMLAHASDDFKRHHLPRILAGDELWCQFFSEPVAGSDLAGVQTRATRDGDSWVLNGAKVWSSWAHLADYGLCLTRTNWSVPKHRGMTWFGVPVDAPGVTLRVIRLINGGADFCEEFFDDVVIPDAERIGDVDDGWRVARTMLVYERGARAEEKPKGPVEPGELATDFVGVARALGRTDDPAARQLIARAHSLDFVYEVLGRRLATRMKHRRRRRRRRRVRRARPRRVRPRARALGHGARSRRLDRVGCVGRRGTGSVDRAHVPQRSHQLGRGRHRPDAAQRHRRAGARSPAGAELGARQAVRRGAARRAALGRQGVGSPRGGVTMARFQLPEDAIPSAWFNVLPVMPEPLQPPLHPGTREPIGPDDLAPLFPMGLIAQEVSAEPWIDVPGEVLDILQALAPDAAGPRRAAGARARHAGAHLLQGRVGVARGLAQDEHVGAAGVLQRGRRHDPARDRDRRRSVGERAVVRVRAVRPRVQGLHGAGVVRAEAVPPGADGDVGRVGRAVTGRRRRQPRLARPRDQ